MKQYFGIIGLKVTMMLVAAALTACSNDTPPQQYQQPVIIQQAPAQPTVVQQDNSGALLTGAVLGAGAAVLMSDRDRNYQQAPQQPANVTYVTKTKIIHQAAPVAAPPPAATPAVAPAPAVNLAKTAPPVVTPNYAAAGTNSPVPVMKAAPVAVPKPTLIPALPAGKMQSYAQVNTTPVNMAKPVSLIKQPAYSPPVPKTAAPVYKQMTYKQVSTRTSYTPPRKTTPSKK